MRKPLWTYLACCIAVFMISMDNLIVTNALPVIRQALHTGLEGLFFFFFFFFYIYFYFFFVFFVSFFFSFQ